MEIYTLPEFFAARYGGRWPRIVAAVAAILCSFTYVVAQIFGVGLITSRIAGVNFEIGILLGLGGVLVCSFLGGMRAVTWTQVAQYVLIMLAYLIPVSWLAYQQTGNPIAPLVYGRQLPHIEAMERQLRESVAEREVLKEYARRAERLDANLRNVDGHLQEEGAQLRQDLRALGESGPDASRAQAIRQELATMPKNADTARELWTRERAEYRERANPLGGLPGHAVAFSGDPNGDAEQQRSYELSRRNFLALMFCLMVGTAGLPHLLTRFYTTPSVSETRNSVAWSLVFIALLYISAPALAVLVKHEVMAHLVGQDFGSLPAWIAQWSKIPSLLTVSDANGDHVLQFAELKIGADLLMLATPEIGGLPYVVSVLVAAGGLAAALSTADGLLLTIGNALAHDLHPEGGVSKAQAMRRVMWSKFALLVVALLAAFVAAQRPAAILYLVSASFSLAGAAFVPAMVLGIFWRRATHDGAVAGMLAGLLVTIYYLGVNQAWLRTSLGLSGDGLWWGIQPVSAGIFGVTAGLCATVLVSLLGRQHGQHSAIANGV
jgi:cation/acetate symporter